MYILTKLRQRCPARAPGKQAYVNRRRILGIRRRRILAGLVDGSLLGDSRGSTRARNLLRGLARGLVPASGQRKRGERQRQGQGKAVSHDQGSRFPGCRTKKTAADTLLACSPATRADSVRLTDIGGDDFASSVPIRSRLDERCRQFPCWPLIDQEARFSWLAGGHLGMTDAAACSRPEDGRE